ncbi:MAG: NAD(P)/FAD-dependent oxidoreductase [Congregibacter sp.]
MQQELDADYLIIGSGAVGMAFADVILAESDATVIMVDRYAKPGGHWNAAYPFVQLHQPSQFYGVSSRELSGGRLERGGLNDGLNELATGAEVSAYFDDVMRHQFLPTGRLQYFPMCDYHADGRFVSKATGRQYHATARRKVVDATFLKTKVPSTHTPNFSIAAEVNFMPLNNLPRVTESPEKYVIVGGGKTAIDACLWLLQMHVDPDMIQWIRPRDAWLLNRRNTQPTEQFFDDFFGSQLALIESSAQALSINALFARLEEQGYFVRIDPSVAPEMFHGATISLAELEALRQIKDVVRLGRVTHLGPDKIQFQQGSLPAHPKNLYVDCSARPFDELETKPVFHGGLITPQMVRSYQPVFSASLIAHVELNYASDEEKNQLAAVVPPPGGLADFTYFTAVSMTNQYMWSQDKTLRDWIKNNRLDGFSQMLENVIAEHPETKELLDRMRSQGPAAVVNLHKLYNDAKGKTTA